MLWRSPYPDVTIPDVSLDAFILGASRERGNKPALIDAVSGRTQSYAELARDVPRVAASLAARGMGKGDVLAVYSPNVIEYATLLYAVSAAGGISTTANPLNTPAELNSQLRNSGARWLVTVPALLANAREAAAGTSVEEIIVLGDADGATPFDALSRTEGEPPSVSIDPESDLAVLPYSSGTTGLNKGVMLTHHNLVGNIRQIEPFRMIDQDSVTLGLLPFFHIYGMVCILHATLYMGATCAILPRFELEQFLGTIERYRVSFAHLVPPIILTLAKHPVVEGHDLSSLRWINSGAAPLDGDLATACRDRIGCTVTQGYGLTETSPVTHFNPSGDPPSSVGPPIPNTECMVVDPTGRPLPEGEQGEILIRGPQVMKGYLNNPRATHMAIDARGWLHTGDLGYADAEGRFYVVDRLKELIKYKGLQVAPAELEALLLSHPAVADAAVIRSPDPEAGEVPKAFVVLEGDATTDDLMAYVAARVAPHKKIRRMEIVDQIPKSASGKILRRVLIEREQLSGVG